MGSEKDSFDISIDILEHAFKVRILADTDHFKELVRKVCQTYGLTEQSTIRIINSGLLNVARELSL